MGIKRGGALDALGFAVVLLMVVYHYGFDAPVPLESVASVFSRGYLATNFFLILSGFVLARAYGQQIDTPSFLRARIMRVWPAQLIVLGVFAVLYLGASFAGVEPRHPENYTVHAFVMQVLLVQAWGMSGGWGWNVPSWALSALVVCYAAFPTLWRALGRVQRPAVLLALALGLVLATDVASRAWLQHPFSDLTSHYPLQRALPLFLLGAMLARAVELQRLPAPAMRWLAAGSLATLVALQALGRSDVPSLVLTALVVGALGQLPGERFERAAKVSFALFITHAATGMVFFAASRHLQLHGLAAWALWAMSFPAAVAVAVLFERFVDSPLQRWLACRPQGAAVPVNA